MPEIKTGDEVRLFAYGTRAGRNFPEDGVHGYVTKTGRKYATASFEWAGVTVEFDMQTGGERLGSGRYYVRTPGQVEAEKRKTAALALLKEAGFEVRLGHRPDGALIEKLAAATLDWAAEQSTRMAPEDRKDT